MYAYMSVLRLSPEETVSKIVQVKIQRIKKESWQAILPSVESLIRTGLPIVSNLSKLCRYKENITYLVLHKSKSKKKVRLATLVQGDPKAPLFNSDYNKV